MNDRTHLAKNRRSWDRTSDDYQKLHARQLSKDPMAWGVWSLPESELNVLGDFAGKDILEYGCGGAQWAIALKKRGAARVVGLDVSARQLHYARRAAAESDAGVRFVLASGEQAPFADATFDIVFCDHGAMTYARPEFTVAEAARLLRPQGRLAFNVNSPFHTVCWDEKKDRVTKRLVHDYFELRVIEDELTNSFTLPYGEWIRLFRTHGLAVEALIEPRPDPKAKTTYTQYVPRKWARKWPAESLWIVTKTG